VLIGIRGDLRRRVSVIVAVLRCTPGRNLTVGA